MAKSTWIGERAREWWVEFCHPTHGDPGVRARLRRCRSTVDALSISPAILLARRLGAVSERSDARWLEQALGLARVLSHAQLDTTDTVMRLAGYQRFPGERESATDANRPLLSEVRFKRLLVTPPGEELVVVLTRLLAQLGGRANIGVLSQDFWWWNDRTRARWAFEYFAAGIALPSDDNIPEASEA